MLVIDTAAGLGPDEILAVAEGATLKLGDALISDIDVRRAEVLSQLDRGDLVYGVNTGMGAASEIRLDAAAQSVQQNTLMLARAVGSAPWLSKQETRAAMAVRLQSFLNGDAGVSVQLCLRLVDMLNLGLHPAIPKTRVGASGEIIPLAHLGGCITGSGVFLDGGETVSAETILGRTGLGALQLGPKEGVALIEGIPVTTGLALLAIRKARLFAEQTLATLTAGLVLIDANRDPYTPPVARADPELAVVVSAVNRLASSNSTPRKLQAPLSYRVAGPAVAHLLRSITILEHAVGRALDGVTDSPAFLNGRFTGTAGFDGFDVAAALDGLRVSLIHLAEVSAARLHRLLDDRITGLPRQLSDRPGVHGGMVAVHKRAAGSVHRLLRSSQPASLGAIETSLGQEDIQSFSLEAAVACSEALSGARDVLACELLALVQAGRLRPGAATGNEIDELIAQVADRVAPGTADRPFGLDVEEISAALADGWAHGLLGS